MRLLDLFCGAGGAAMGYWLSGLATEIVGVDIKHQPRYPFDFVQADALEYLAKHGHKFDIITGSPPCQAYTVLRAVCGDRIYPDLVAPTRELMKATGKPYVIENVPGSPLINPVTLCGTHFGLKVYRHRLFECNPWLMSPPHFPHQDKSPGAGKGLSPKGFVTVCGGGRGRTKLQVGHANPMGYVTVAGHIANVDYCREAMGINWMTGRELSQAIPPSYTKWIGEQLKLVLEEQSLWQC